MFIVAIAKPYNDIARFCMGAVTNSDYPYVRLGDSVSYLLQGVVTLIAGPVEPFATGIKMKSSDQEASAI